MEGFRNAARRSLISTHGGVQPTWRHDGKEVVYLAPDATMMGVSIDEREGALEISPPKKLFHVTMNADRVAHQYRMTSDGQRFIVSVPVEAQTTPSFFTVLLNWRDRVESEARR